ncbi:MAG: tetratricopeptide repeat protein, partial [Clostridiales bacterium]|nr:tetratricopeptide repeat protein [Clostridiales bacterium]
KKANGSDNPMVALLNENLGLVLRELGDIEKAREFIERALEINKKTLPPNDPETARSAGNLVLCNINSAN